MHTKIATRTDERAEVEKHAVFLHAADEYEAMQSYVKGYVHFINGSRVSFREVRLDKAQFKDEGGRMKDESPLVLRSSCRLHLLSLHSGGVAKW